MEKCQKCHELLAAECHDGVEIRPRNEKNGFYYFVDCRVELFQEQKFQDGCKQDVLSHLLAHCKASGTSFVTLSPYGDLDSPY